MTLARAFAQISRGDGGEAAWGLIYSSLQPRLLAYVSALLVTFRISDTDLASDLVHDAMLAVLPGWSKSKIRIDNIEGLERYLKRTCRNALLDRYRHQKSAERLLDFIDLTFTRAFDSEAEIHRSIFVDEIIRQMPAECARILLRYVQDDVTPAELADEEGASPATFYTRWYRCLQKAKIFLESRNIGSSDGTDKRAIGG
jgi:RNA polymerase sigma factor (sigma-70 family)